MSVTAVTWVLQFSDERLGNRLVLIALADHAHSDGSNAFPSVKTIAREARMSERNVQRALRALEQSGAIRSCGRHHSGSMVYEVVGVQIWQGATNPASGGDNSAPELKENRHKNFRVTNCRPCPECGVSPKGKTLAQHLEDVHGVRAA